MIATFMKRKVFVSYSRIDEVEVRAFVQQWAVSEGVFIPKLIGAGSRYDLIESEEADYIMSVIRRDFIGDATVTMVLVGECTHSRRYVDWEIKASLRRGEYLPNGLLGVTLPSRDGAALLSPRFERNWTENHVNCYARYKRPPRSADELRGYIEDAFSARTDRATLIDNPQEMMRYNSRCRSHGVTH